MWCFPVVLKKFIHCQSDLRLVASNAKLFNPPGTIYHTEADRIESWGLDHIAKAAPTVIQYETDWNIEIEKDDDDAINIDDDDEYPEAIQMDVDETGRNGRSSSVTSQVLPETSRRATRGPYKKATPSTTISESIDAEGRLPGSKDGLGAFPPTSDWAHLMLALKLKGTIFNCCLSVTHRLNIIFKENGTKLRKKDYVSKRKVRRCIKMEA